MKIQRSSTKRKRPGRLDKKMANKMSISGRIFHQSVVKIFFLGGLHLILGQAFHQSAAAFRMCPVTTTKAFFHAIFYSLIVACILYRPNRQNIFLLCRNLRTVNHNGHNYLLLQCRSIL